VADIFWIKLKLNMFDDEKVKLIETMPEGDAILIILIKLFIQAGKTNANGYIFLSENIPITPEMFSTLFRKSLPIVKLALKTLVQFGMISIEDDGKILINNWDKHQNVEGMEKIKEQNRIRQQKFREKQKLLMANSNGTHNVSVTEEPNNSEIEPSDEILNSIKVEKSTENEDQVTLHNVSITEQRKSKRKSKNIYNENSNEFRLAFLLFGLIKERNTEHKPPNLQDWAAHIGLMIRKDNRHPDKIETVIRWSQKEDFWQNNILSTKKLREQFDQLVLKMKGNGKDNRIEIQKPFTIEEFNERSINEN